MNHLGNLVHDGEKRLDRCGSQRSDAIAATDDDLEAPEHPHKESMGSEKPGVEIHQDLLSEIRDQSHEDPSESVSPSDGEPTNDAEVSHVLH
jgi:hypothetical protein